MDTETAGAACDFCGKTAQQCRAEGHGLVAGKGAVPPDVDAADYPAKASICRECADLASEILSEPAGSPAT